MQISVTELGGLDVLVNNAGDFPVAPLEKMSLETLNESISINLRTAFVSDVSTHRTDLGV